MIEPIAVGLVALLVLTITAAIVTWIDGPTWRPRR